MGESKEMTGRDCYSKLRDYLIKNKLAHMYIIVGWMLGEDDPYRSGLVLFKKKARTYIDRKAITIQ